MHKKIILAVILFSLLTPSVWGLDRKGRLGLGVSNQLKIDTPAISIKIQSSRSFAFGGLAAISSDDQSGGYAMGVKIYSIIFEEPQLNFYSSVLGALLNTKQNGKDNSGFQFDFTLGTEFSFSGLESIGFSFELGFSLHKQDQFIFETVGEHFIGAGIHFYI